MITWMITNYKATIAIFTAVLTSVVVPMWFFAIGMVAKIESASSMVSLHDTKIIKLEEAFYRNDERNIRMEKMLQRIEDREYSELKQARQERMKKQ